MPGAEVASVSGVTLMPPEGVSSTPSPGFRKERSAFWPMARMQASASMVSTSSSS
jgi:hypothetical protein